MTAGAVDGAVDRVAVGRALRAFLAGAGTELLLHDRATGGMHVLAVDLAGDPAGLLPVLLVAGEAVWREATGETGGFALRIRPDRDALLGYRLDGIGDGTFCTVALSAIEAIDQAQGGRADRLLVNDLIGPVWRAVLDRADRSGTAAPTSPPSAGASAAASSPPSGVNP